MFQISDGWFVKATGIKLSRELLTSILISCNIEKNSPKRDGEKDVPEFDHFFDIPIFDYDDHDVEEDEFEPELKKKEFCEYSGECEPTSKNEEQNVKLQNTERVSKMMNKKENQPNSGNNNGFLKNNNPPIYLISQSVGFSVKNKFITEEKLKCLLELTTE